jgi:hypothetical protein
MSATAALAWAHDQIGTAESPHGSNKGPKITQWEIDSGYPWVEKAAAGVSWCQCFANAVAAHGGAPLIKDGYTPDFLAGHYAKQGYVPGQLAGAHPGAFVYFKWPGVSRAICDHIGVLVAMTATTVTCIEGNTSPSSAGSQNNGGGVYLKTRSRSLVAGAVSVPYTGSESKPFRPLTDGDEGDDVRAFQQAVNKRADGCGRSDRRCAVDGVCGPETLGNGAWAAYILGIGDSQKELRAGGISAYVQTLVRDPDERNQAQKDRAGQRREEAGCKP